MTGSACSSSSTGARHPSLLQQQGCRENEDNDKLRRMAIKNSYESRSLCGGPGVSSVVQPDLGLVENASKASTAKILPSLAANKQLYNPHRHSSKCRRPAQKPAQAQSCTSTPTTTRPRSLSAAMRISTTKIHPSTVHDVGASAGDDPRLGAGSKTAPQLVSDTGTHMLADSKGSSKSRSSAHVAGSSELTSVSLSQPNADSSTSSSYIYHIPNRMIQRGRSRSQSRVHAHMHTHNVVPSLSMKRSSSHSTVALHRTGHHHHHHPSPLASIVPSPPTAGIGTPMATSSLTQSVIHPAHVQTTDYHLPEDYHTPHPPHHRPYRQGNAWMGGSLSQDVLDGAGSQVSYCPAAGRHNRVYEVLSQESGLVESQSPQTLKHAEHARTASGRRRRQSDFLPRGRSQLSQPPDIVHHRGEFDVPSSYRHRYHSATPQSLVEPMAGQPTARLGSSPHFQSSNSVAAHLPLVPHPPPHHTRDVHPDSIRRRRVTLHTPRGNKVASLV